MLTMVLLFIGTTEVIVIGGIALLIFGGKKLPELMRGLGKGVKEFKDGVNGTETAEEQSESASASEGPQQTDSSSASMPKKDE